MFLKFNFYPAKIFLGDSGALLLGYCFALASVLGVLKSTVFGYCIGVYFCCSFNGHGFKCYSTVTQTAKYFLSRFGAYPSSIGGPRVSVPTSAIILYFITVILVWLQLLRQINHGCSIYSLGGAISRASCLFSVLQLSKNKLKT